MNSTAINFETPAPAVDVAWDDPVPFDAVDAPPFPGDALPSWAQTWCEEEARALQVPFDLPAMLLLAVTSLCIAKKIGVQVKDGWIEPTNLYVLIALGVGEGKSPVFAHATAPIHEWEVEQRAELAATIAAAEERQQILQERIRHLRQKAAKPQNTATSGTAEEEACALAVELSTLTIPVLPRLIADDATPEAVGRLLAEQGGRLAILSSEGGPLAIMAGRYSEGRANLELYCKAYSADPYTLDRVNRAGLQVRAPHLTLALTVQPSIIAGLRATPEMRGQGLLARFLYSIPKSRVGAREVDPEPMRAATKARYEMTIGKMLAFDSARDAHGELFSRVILLTPEAKEEVIAFKARLEPRLGPEGDLRAIADWGNKLPGTIVRIACVLHVAMHVESDRLGSTLAIDRCNVMHAIKIGDYAIAHARAAFLLMQADPDEELAKRILEWLLRHDRVQATQRDIQRGVHARSVKELRGPIEILVGRGYLREADARATGGRPHSPMYDINPRAKR